MQRIILLVPLVVFAGLAVTAEETDQHVAEEIIAITKAQWAAEKEKNVEEAMKNVADEYTEFNPNSPVRVDGKALAIQIQEALATGNATSVLAEMANEKVQVYGDVAILTYNYFGAVKDESGNIEQTPAKSTRVYAKKNGKWMLVHANFAVAN
jgi:ketosteroid isomerase-like protein